MQKKCTIAKVRIYNEENNKHTQHLTKIKLYSMWFHRLHRFHIYIHNPISRLPTSIIIIIINYYYYYRLKCWEKGVLLKNMQPMKPMKPFS